ncbi:uncharacterized protein B0T23DRAFT_212797 [Neurospora hispaniola]|uniref:Pentatricopeptide repeat-containing protein-mitochondrial domain-containing protein n=1 Tax=Neurospora hispaniola TaxID=588809 RepID=A0AAJ0I1N7_9PEZI|nr:hypothetical protein B0T23DRAFT_212797 [Neurospora hispaniola]
MPPPRQVIDGLWRCLCPSVDATLLAKAPTLSSTSAIRSRSRVSRKDGLHRHRGARSLSQQSHGYRANIDSFVSPDLYIEPKWPQSQQKSETVADATVTATEIIQATNDLTEVLKEASTPVIYEALRELRNHHGQHGKIRPIIQFLLNNRKEKPNPFIYESLVVANWDITGSADELGFIFDSMVAAGVEPSIGVLQSALKALAVHPDYLLRTDILRSLGAKGARLDKEAKISVTLGLLRDGQFEKALDLLDELVYSDQLVPAWVFEIFIYTLARRGFVEEAVRVMQVRLKARNQNTPSRALPLGTWYFLLDECSRALHHEGTKLVWDHLVQKRLVNPPDGVVINVLNTASRHQDADLATRAIELLAERGVRLGLHHYEALVECYAYNGDLLNALQVLGIMEGADISPGAASTRSIFLLFRRSPELLDGVKEMMENLKAAGYKIPIAALNVVLEAVCEEGPTVDKAFGMYRDLLHLCSSGPDLRTFQILLQKAQKAQTAQELESEMLMYTLKPTRDMYEDFVRCSIVDGDLNTAFNYLAQMELAPLARNSSRRMWISHPTLVQLLKRCFNEMDPRAWAVVDVARERKIDLEIEIKKLLAEMPKETAVSDQRAQEEITMMGAVRPAYEEALDAGDLKTLSSSAA